MNKSSYNSNNFQLKKSSSSKEIFLIILCCILCFPVGILTIIIYIKSHIYWENNETEKALKYGTKAKEWAINGILVSVVLFFIYIILSSINVFPNYEKYLFEIKEMYLE